MSTAKGSADTTAIMAEVDDIWPEFQKEADKAHLNSAIVSANSAPSTAVFSQGWKYNVVYSKDQQGQWSRSGPK